MSNVNTNATVIEVHAINVNADLYIENYEYCIVFTGCCVITLILSCAIMITACVKYALNNKQSNLIFFILSFVICAITSIATSYFSNTYREIEEAHAIDIV